LLVFPKVCYNAVMYKKHKYDIIAILALLCFGIALFLSISHYLGFAVPCTVTHGCETVLTSKYAVLFGLPLAVWGVAYFTAVIICCLMANHYASWRKILTVVLSLGALSSLVFLSLQFFVIKNICQYCLTTDLLSIFLLILDMNIEYQALP
jgi:uncharacterized membrane protein